MTVYALQTTSGDEVPSESNWPKLLAKMEDAKQCALDVCEYGEMNNAEVHAWDGTGEVSISDADETSFLHLIALEVEA